MTEYEEYKQTGMLGSYQPERTLLRETDDGVQPVFRDTTYHYDEDAVIVERDMMVGQALLPCHLYLPASQQLPPRRSCWSASTQV